MSEFGMRKTLRATYDQALARVPEALKTEGFGVLTQIDMKETLKKKLDVDFRRYTILGACNPPFARDALQESLEVGLLLPCNVVVYENDEGRAEVLAVDPNATMARTGNPRLTALAQQVKTKLERVLERLE